MKIFSKLKNSFKISKKVVAIATVSALALAIPIAARASFGPNRQILDWNNPATHGGFDHPVFNSFINTPSYGDERAFLDARPATQQVTSQNYDPLVNTTSSDVVVIRTYVHNNGNQDLNASGATVALNTKVKIDLPTNTGTNLQLKSTISADNANTVFDTVDLTDSNSFGIEYVPGSAVVINGANTNGIKVNDSIVSGGALIGYDQMNGKFPGCFNYQAFVEIKVRILKPKLTVKKEVRKAGDKVWHKSVEAIPGDKLQWAITLYNAGNTQLNNSMVFDQLPPHLDVVPNSVRYIDASQDVIQRDTPLFTDGILFDRPVLSDGGYYYRFDTIVKGDEPQCSTVIRNIAHAKAKEATEITDSADVTITRQNCNPSFSCSSLDSLKISDNSYKFTAHGSVANTTLDGYVFKVNGSTKQDSASDVYNFNESTPGSYTVTAQVKTPLGISEVGNCSKTINIEVKPAYSCDVLDSTKLTRNSYKFTAHATAQNVSITGYIFKLDGVTKQESASDNYTAADLSDGDHTVTAQVKLSNNAVTDITSGCSKMIHVETAPGLSCDSLMYNKINRTTYDFAANVTKTGAVNITGYVFKVNGAVVQDNASSTYHFVAANVGDYIVSVAIKATIDGQANVVTSEGCSKKITVEKEAETPVYSCDLLSAVQLNRNTYRFTISTTASGGATIKNYVYDFGAAADSSDTLLTDKNTADFTYAKDGNYVTHVKVTFTVNGEDKTVESDACAKTIVVSPEVCTLDASLRKDDEKCKPCASNPNIVDTDTRCAHVLAVKTLPNTGSGNIVVMAMLVAVAAAAAHYVVTGRQSKHGEA